MSLESEFIEATVIEGSKLAGEAAKRPDKHDLRRDHADDTAKLQLFCKHQTRFRFALNLVQSVSCCKHVGVQVVAAIGCKCQIARLDRGVERATDQLPSRLDMASPRHDQISESHVDPRSKPTQFMLFDQFVTE